MFKHLKLCVASTIALPGLHGLCRTHEASRDFTSKTREAILSHKDVPTVEVSVANAWDDHQTWEFHMISLSTSTVTKTRELVWPWQWRKNPTVRSSMTSVKIMIWPPKNADIICNPPTGMWPPKVQHTNTVEYCGYDQKKLQWDWGSSHVASRIARMCQCLRSHEEQSTFRDAWKSSGLSMKSRDGETYETYAKTCKKHPAGYPCEMLLQCLSEAL